MKFKFTIGLTSYFGIIGVLGYLFFMLPYFAHYNISPQWDYNSLSIFIIILIIVLFFIIMTFLLLYMIASLYKICPVLKRHQDAKVLNILFAYHKRIFAFIGLFSVIFILLEAATNMVLLYICLITSLLILLISLYKKSSKPLITYLHFINISQ